MVFSCELAFWPRTPLTMAAIPDSRKNRSLRERLLAEVLDSCLVPGLTAGLRLSSPLTVPLAEPEQGCPASSIPGSRYRTTTGWQRPESCGSRGPIPIYRPYYAVGGATAMESSDYQWIQLVTSIRGGLIGSIVQMRLWRGSCRRYMEAEYGAVHFAAFKVD